MSTTRASQIAVDNMVREMSKDHKSKVNVVGIDSMESEGSYVRVTAFVSNSANTEKNHNVVPLLISNALDSRLHHVPQSFQVLAASEVGRTVTGIFSLNPETVAYEEDMDGFKAVSGNMFMDDEEGLWVLRKTDAGKILVKSTGMEDADIIADLMPAVASASGTATTVGSQTFEATASMNSDNSIRSRLEGGDFVTFVNPKSEAVEFGVIVASVSRENGTNTKQIVIQSSDAEEDYTITDRGMVIAKIEGVDVGDMGVIESAAQKSLDEIAAYYKQMFIRDPNYYEQFMARFQSRIFA